ncbi:hypothetical protein IW150_001841 [Coemansia sp. RSA 2607]|nr:hypothetical protein IW150_001841 [Coemansia sp. RSA 2607]KAJ2386430.1 hypothetical protein GGI05_004388 [Coemansia sp. RSA 2603]
MAKLKKRNAPREVATKAVSTSVTQRRPQKSNSSTSGSNGENELQSEGSNDSEYTDEEQAQSTGSSTPNIPSNVVGKLAVFSLLLLIAPIITYFISLKYVFVGATATSAIAAVIVANIVLAAFVYAAWTEELEDVPKQMRKDS